MPVSARPHEPWHRRLYLPHYQVQEAAKYAQIDTGTVRRWQKDSAARELIAPRGHRAALSYMQLIELAVVAALRKHGVKLNRIRDAREWFQKTLRSEFPFAEYRFKTDGKGLFNEFEQISGSAKNRGTLVRPDQGGQLAWEKIIGRLKEFDYENKKRVIRWRVGGEKSAVVIDPRISFGAPMVKGVGTWAIKGRWEAGETPTEIAADFGLRNKDVIDALVFEEVDRAQLRKWLN